MGSTSILASKRVWPTLLRARIEVWNTFIRARNVVWNTSFLQKQRVFHTLVFARNNCVFTVISCKKYVCSTRDSCKNSCVEHMNSPVKHGCFTRVKHVCFPHICSHKCVWNTHLCGTKMCWPKSCANSLASGKHCASVSLASKILASILLARKSWPLFVAKVIWAFGPYHWPKDMGQLKLAHLYGPCKTWPINLPAMRICIICPIKGGLFQTPIWLGQICKLRIAGGYLARDCCSNNHLAKCTPAMQKQLIWAIRKGVVPTPVSTGPKHCFCIAGSNIWTAHHVVTISAGQLICSKWDWPSSIVTTFFADQILLAHNYQPHIGRPIIWGSFFASDYLSDQYSTANYSLAEYCAADLSGQ